MFTLYTPLSMPNGSMIGIEGNLGVNQASKSLYSDFDISMNDSINSPNRSRTYSFYFRAYQLNSLYSDSTNFVKSYANEGTYFIRTSYICSNVNYSSQTVVKIEHPSRKIVETSYSQLVFFNKKFYHI